MSDLLSRKFIGFLVIVLMLFVLVIVGKINPDTFISFVSANFGVYVLGNVADKVVGK